jgi:hypothetical protein
MLRIQFRRELLPTGRNCSCDPSRSTPRSSPPNKLALGSHPALGSKPTLGKKLDLGEKLALGTVLVTEWS